MPGSGIFAAEGVYDGAARSGDDPAALEKWRYARYGIVRTVWLAAALVLGGCSSPAGPLPSGTYHYSSNEAGVPVDSTVTISRDATAIVVHEDAQLVKLPNAPPVSIDIHLDPTTFSTRAVTVANDPEMWNPSVAIARDSATITSSGHASFTVASVAHGDPATVDSEWVSSYVAIPAMLHATGGKTLVTYYTAQVHGRGLATAFTVVPATATRPGSVASGDASIALATRKARRAFITLWYDPSTDVVSAVQLGDDLAFVRK